MSIYEKLSAIQHELVVPKEQKNNFGNFNYRSCEDILKALKPICEKYNAVVYITNDLVCIGERNYVKAEAVLTDLETGEHLSSVAHAREEDVKKGMDGSQITGSSSSYARKYALAGLFCIDNEKDSDAYEEPPTYKTTPKTRQDYQQELLELGVELAPLEKFYGKSFNELTQQELIDAIQRKKRQLEIKKQAE